MKKEQTEINRLADDIIEELSRSEYTENNLESFEHFKERKKHAIDEYLDQQIDVVFVGIGLFRRTCKNNKRIDSLQRNFMIFNENPALKNATVESLSQSMKEHNLYGLNDEDFDELMAAADLAYDQKQYLEAFAMYRALTVLYPCRFESWLKIAGIVNEQHYDYTTVLNIYERCLKIDNHPIIYFAIGVCHLKGNERKLAEDNFYKALELCDKYGEQDLKEKISALLDKMKTKALIK